MDDTDFSKTQNLQSFQEILNECKNKTLIVITHDTDIIPYMDDVINLNQLEK